MGSLSSSSFPPFLPLNKSLETINDTEFPLGARHFISKGAAILPKLSGGKSSLPCSSSSTTSGSPQGDTHTIILYYPPGIIVAEQWGKNISINL